MTPGTSPRIRNHRLSMDFALRSHDRRPHWVPFWNQRSLTNRTDRNGSERIGELSPLFNRIDADTPVMNLSSLGLLRLTVAVMGIDRDRSRICCRKSFRNGNLGNRFRHPHPAGTRHEGGGYSGPPTAVTYRGYPANRYLIPLVAGVPPYGIPVVRHHLWSEPDRA
jgi:hypothetical protein